MPAKVLAALALLAFATPVFAQSGFTPLVDFRHGAHGWHGNHFVEDFRATPDGIAFRSTGRDPWIESPVLENLPADDRVELRIRMRSTADRSGEIFVGPVFTQDKAVQFVIKNDGDWHEYTVLLPPVPPGARLRIDPAASPGDVTIAAIETRLLPPAINTEVTPAVPFDIPPDSPAISSANLRVEIHPQRFNAFAVIVDGVEMARSHAAARIGYLHEGVPQYLDFANANLTRADRPGDAITLTAQLHDAAGAQWQWSLTFTPAGPNAIALESRVTVSEPRLAFHLPLVTLLPGHGTFGQRKTQALLPGVEYLADEPSSSEADLRGDQAIRRMVAGYRINYPMMAIVHQDRYLGLLWNRPQAPQAVFDSPDTLLDSGAHLFGLWYPAAGDARRENSLEIQHPIPSTNGAFPTVHATIIGGHGQSVVPAIQHFVQRRGLPDLPEFEGGFDAAVTLLARGWLDSALHEDGLWRHAVWHDQFRAQPAADAVTFMQWLAHHTQDDALRNRLQDAAQRGIERLPRYSDDARLNEDPQANPAGQAVGHVRRHTPALVLGPLEPYIEARLRFDRFTLAQFTPDGIRPYQHQQGKPDYSETHFANHANGYAATTLAEILETAVLTGDPEATAAAIALLDKQTTLYANSVPRGAQTWEIPLHTPDILASARLVQCYVLGFLLTGREDLLEQARYWAWTGLAFIYLDNPTPGPIGPYATIAVLGATNWVSPNWIGLPVQWCGLVYRSAIQELALIDHPNAPLWNQLAKGITICGLQQTFPLTDQRQQGLLPDFVHLQIQLRDGPAINPGTVQFHLPETYGKTPFHQRKRLTHTGAIVSAPGAIQIQEDQPRVITLNITPWMQDAPSTVIISHLPGQWRITQSDTPGGPPQPHEHLWQTPTAKSRLTIQLQAPATLTLEPVPSGSTQPERLPQ